MRIGILGTGVVGRTIAGRLAEIGHEVMLGTRDVGRTMASTAPGPTGLPAFRVWLGQSKGVKPGSLSQAARHGEVVVNATSGTGSVEALTLAGASNLNGKVLIDVSNPLDFSLGMPPSLFVCNTDSLGEQIQRAFPAARVVKTLNTVTASLMVSPRQLDDGQHHVFVSGNDSDAKAQVTDWLMTWFGWRQVIDLGGITSARAAEMYLPIWLRLWGVLATGMFNIKVVR